MNADEVSVLHDTLQQISMVPAMEQMAVDLRDRDVAALLGGEVVAVMTPYARLYAWCPSSTSADDGMGVLKPVSVGSTQGGRWLLLARQALMPAGSNFDFPSIADGAYNGANISVPGAELGDFVVASAGVDLQGITLTTYVSAQDQVTFQLHNESGGAVDLANTPFRVIVFKK